MRSITR